MIPASHLFDQSLIAAPLDADPLVTDARAFFSCFDWSVVERGPAERSSSGLLAPAHDWRHHSPFGSGPLWWGVCVA